MSSWRRIVLPSRRRATIRTYGRTREFTSVGSSSTKPSRFNVSGSNIAGDASIDGDSSTLVVSTVIASGESALGASTVSWRECPTGGGTAASLGADGVAFRRAAVLSFFLFALPCSV